MQDRDALGAVQWLRENIFTLETTDGDATDSATTVSCAQLLTVSSSSGVQLPVSDLAASLSAVAASAIHANSLTCLKLWNNNLGPEGALLLVQAIRGLPNLLVLSLGCNSIGARGMKAIGPALTTSRSGQPVLQTLDLTQNVLGYAGIKALVPFLSNLTALQCLRLANNDVTDAGVKILGPSLTKLSASLCELDLSNNSFGALGTEALGQQLGALTRLQKLHLSSNSEMSSQGKYALWPDICNLSSLQVGVSWLQLLL